MNRTYQYLLIIISAKKYSYESLFSKLDLFLMLDRITQEQYVELTSKLEGEKNEGVTNYEELED
jgi:hypothetical protein